MEIVFSVVMLKGNRIFISLGLLGGKYVFGYFFIINDLYMNILCNKWVVDVVYGFM